MDVATRLEIPTPFDVGRVNCYVFEHGGLTLLDPGPATEEAYTELSTGLAALGYEIVDVERVLISHPHMDHFGLANRIAREADARVVAHDDAANRLADPLGLFRREQALFGPYLRSMGLPEQYVDTVVGIPEQYTEFGEPVEIDRGLVEGETVDAGVTLEALATPGHAPASLCFIASNEDVVFTGDHVLAGISPNPLLTVAPGTDDRRTRSLPDYIASLRKLAALDVSRGYGGHRGPIPDLGARITEIDDHHQERKERIAGLLDDDGPTSAYRVMGELFPDLPATEMFPGMSEVIGHLDLLEDEGRVDITEVDGVKRYGLA